MNVWECGEPGCKSVAHGVGGAVGLRAIGWTFAMGGTPMCPSHGPEMIPCERGDEESMGQPCRSCAGEAQAKRIQETLTSDVDRASLEALKPRIDIAIPLVHHDPANVSAFRFDGADIMPAKGVCPACGRVVPGATTRTTRGVFLPRTGRFHAATCPNAKTDSERRAAETVAAAPEVLAPAARAAFLLARMVERPDTYNQDAIVAQARGVVDALVEAAREGQGES